MPSVSLCSRSWSLRGSDLMELQNRVGAPNIHKELGQTLQTLKEKCCSFPSYEVGFRCLCWGVGSSNVEQQRIEASPSTCLQSCLPPDAFMLHCVWYRGCTKNTALLALLGDNSSNFIFHFVLQLCFSHALQRHAVPVACSGPPIILGRQLHTWSFGKTHQRYQIPQLRCHIWKTNV